MTEVRFSEVACHGQPHEVSGGPSTSQEVHLQLTLKQTLTQAWTSKEYLGWWWKPLGYFGSREPKRLGVRVD